jgi:hypothetical protein
VYKKAYKLYLMGVNVYKKAYKLYLMGVNVYKKAYKLYLMGGVGVEPPGGVGVEPPSHGITHRPFPGIGIMFGFIFF